VRDVLEENRLTRAWRGNNEAALPLAQRCHQIDDPCRQILGGRIVRLHTQPFIRIERRQIVEMDLVADLLRILEIDRVDLQKREIALAFLWAADRPLDRVA
jgi:hypothetical protein